MGKTRKGEIKVLIIDTSAEAGEKVSDEEVDRVIETGQAEQLFQQAFQTEQV